ncbi:hypothetical protein SARC_00654 [Sphaeroforma arctica JP610]|uniref:Golgi apparatus membrane protein TVP38 n=1 Tax=Sphaeroforma arctica JP610 TaxID=667725 RepID=A0A0L0GE93_9EUKA|nr:hypothetical protein SARC_00654 [Sphaeroforma arctica JP610]KNC87219.1 hypothetical protein SARC_00654 [Sphaeroforma arctica JP610]|eukprot:XP_014161121.1 hypothetical protein SARC_00654 [Sphaeroforma arctica JP610]
MAANCALRHRVNPYIVLLVTVTLILIVCSFIFKDSLLKHLGEFAEIIRDAGTLGILICWFLVVITSVPPMPGYSASIITCGYLYGYKGFFLAYFGALAGATFAFTGGRWLFKEQVERKLMDQPRMSALAATIAVADFKMLVLIRIAPYPYTILNVLFSVTDIPLTQFVAATAISLVKVIIHVSVGVSLSSLDNDTRETSTGEYLLLIFGGILTVYLTFYAYKVSQAAVDRHTHQALPLNSLETVVEEEAEEVQFIPSRRLSILS